MKRVWPLLSLLLMLVIGATFWLLAKLFDLNDAQADMLRSGAIFLGIGVALVITEKRNKRLAGYSCVIAGAAFVALTLFL